MSSWLRLLLLYCYRHPMNTTSSKYVRVRDALADAIRSGEYVVGQKLPGERTLATQYGISYMTARRAVSELVELGLLDRRPWEGLFVTAVPTTELNNITSARNGHHNVDISHSASPAV